MCVSDLPDLAPMLSGLPLAVYIQIADNGCKTLTNQLQWLE